MNVLTENAAYLGIIHILRQHQRVPGSAFHFLKKFFRIRENIEKSLKKPKIIKENLIISYFSYFFQKFFRNSTKVLSSDKIQTAEIWYMTNKVSFAASILFAAF